MHGRRFIEAEPVLPHLGIGQHLLRAPDRSVPVGDLADTAVWRPRGAWSGAGSRLRSLIVGGSSDPYHDPAGFDAVATALDAATLIVPNADHALEVPGDVHATLNAMQSLIPAVLEFYI